MSTPIDRHFSLGAVRTFWARCPHCRKLMLLASAYGLPPLVGRNIRCENCREPFVLHNDCLAFD
jgi:hypothetical protein